MYHRALLLIANSWVNPDDTDDPNTGINPHIFTDGLGWHWTTLENATQAIQTGLGTRKWTSAPHHTWPFWMELPDEYRKQALKLHPDIAERTNVPEGHPFHDTVDHLIKEAYQDLYMSWVGTTKTQSMRYGTNAVVVNISEMDGTVEGWMFPDHYYGWCLMTFGRIPPEFLSLSE